MINHLFFCCFVVFLLSIISTVNDTCSNLTVIVCMFRTSVIYLYPFNFMVVLVLKFNGIV